MGNLQTISKGAAANDGTGTKARDAADILNANAAELEARIALKSFQDRLTARYNGARVGLNNPRHNNSELFAGPVTIGPTSGTVPTATPIANALPLGTSETLATYALYQTRTPGWLIKNAGVPIIVARDTTTSSPNQNYGATGNSSSNVARMGFETDDPTFSVEVQGGSGVVRVIIDGKFTNLAGYQADPAGGNGTRYLPIDLTVGGTVVVPRKFREIWVEGQAIGFGRVVRSSKNYTVRPIRDPGPRLLIIDDSWGAGAGALLTINSSARALGDFLGCSMVGINAQGGTGYATPVGSTTQTYLDRMPDFLQFNPDAIIIKGATNDISAYTGGSLTLSAWQTRFSNTLTSVRAQHPLLPIAATFGFATSDTLTFSGAMEDAGAQIVADRVAAGDKRIDFVKSVRPVPIFSGTSTNTAKVDDGNRALFVFGSNQSAHPNDDGHVEVGRFLAPAVYSAFMGMQ